MLRGSGRSIVFIFKTTMYLSALVTFSISAVSLIFTSNAAYEGLFSDTINISITTRSVTSAASSRGNLTLPDAIVFGIRKCGTRAVLQFLNIHPDVVVANSEVHFFDRNLHKGVKWYMQQLPRKTSTHQLAIEKTPGYFITRDAPRALHAIKKDIKLILIVKDPITRAISDYAQINERRSKLNESLATFEELAMYENGKFGGKTINIKYKPLWISIYHYHFNNWLEYFPMENIHIVDGDLFVKDPYTELKKVEEFLKLRSFMRREMFHFNKTKGFYCSTVNSSADHNSHTDTNSNSFTAAKAINSNKQSSIKTSVSLSEADSNTLCLGESKGRKHPEVDPVVIKKLMKFFRPHNLLFFNMIGKSFPAWMGMKDLDDSKT